MALRFQAVHVGFWIVVFTSAIFTSHTATKLSQKTLFGQRLSPQFFTEVNQPKKYHRGIFLPTLLDAPPPPSRGRPWFVPRRWPRRARPPREAAAPQCHPHQQPRLLRPPRQHRQIRKCAPGERQVATERISPLCWGGVCWTQGCCG